MNARRLALTALTLTTVALAGAQTSIALVTDTGIAPTAFAGVTLGGVHRWDTKTGAYLGSFGGGMLYSPMAVAIQPSTNEAFVADYYGVKRFDVESGAFRGYATSFWDLHGVVYGMKFDGKGHLIMAVSKGTAAEYVLMTLDTLTGAILDASSTAVPFDPEARVSVGFRKTGGIEVFRSYWGRSYADNYDAGLGAFRGSEVLGSDLDDYRTSSDTFFRITPAALRTGSGLFGLGSSLSTLPGVIFGVVAEGASSQTFTMVKAPSWSTPIDYMTISRYDTSATPILKAVVSIADKRIGRLTDMAIYSK